MAATMSEFKSRYELSIYAARIIGRSFARSDFDTLDDNGEVAAPRLPLDENKRLTKIVASFIDILKTNHHGIDIRYLYNAEDSKLFVPPHLQAENFMLAINPWMYASKELGDIFGEGGYLRLKAVVVSVAPVPELNCVSLILQGRDDMGETLSDITVRISRMLKIQFFECTSTCLKTDPLDVAFPTSGYEEAPAPFATQYQEPLDVTDRANWAVFPRAEKTIRELLPKLADFLAGVATRLQEHKQREQQQFA